jgi:hypothetical protein
MWSKPSHQQNRHTSSSKKFGCYKRKTNFFVCYIGIIFSLNKGRSPPSIPTVMTASPHSRRCRGGHHHRTVPSWPLGRWGRHGCDKSSQDPAADDGVKRSGRSTVPRVLAGASPSARSSSHGLSLTHRISAGGRARWRRVLTEAQEVRSAMRQGKEATWGRWGDRRMGVGKLSAATEFHPARLPLLVVDPLWREQGWSGA